MIKKYQAFSIPIGNAKIMDEIQFRPAEPVIKQHQKTSNSCCLSSLASAFHSIGDDRYVTALEHRITESLTLQTDKFRNRINIANAIMTNIMYIKSEQKLRYNPKVWHNKDYFYILNNRSKYVTFVQLMDTLGNVNHSISIVGYWIFESNYDNSLFLTQESLDLICCPSIGLKKVAIFQSGFNAVICIWETIRLKEG